MTPERWQEVKPILAAALELGPEDRRDYVDRSCSDLSLRAEVLSLIAAHDEMDISAEAPARSPAQPLKNGMQLGSYTILGPVGAGGMGEVYEATDSKLGRKVAIKVLPQTMEYGPGQLLRFKREAKTLASLNHPGICTVFDVGEHEGRQFIVMELLQGQTLRERLNGKPFAIREVLDWGVQIGDGLDFAHSHGIIHRDIKPANIFITKRGQAKILDFGLAKQMPQSTRAPDGEGGIVTDESKELTGPGVAVGTVSYMSPEQALGEDADARSDIFSFGAVLYEMATGRKAFDANNSVSILMKILESDPPAVSSLQSAAPAALDRAIATCLAKRPDERWQSVRDLARELRWLAEPRSGAELRTAAGGRRIVPRRNIGWVWTAVALLSIAALAVAGFAYFDQPQPDAPTMRFFVSPPAKWGLTLQQDGIVSRSPAPLAVSPDGRIAFVATGPEGKTLIWIRSLNELDARALEGTEGASSPFWSPDGRELGFFADGKLKKIDASGGAPVTLCDAPNNRGGTWSQDGAIVFAPSYPAALFRVSAAGGTPTAATIMGNGDLAHFRPFFLPDGRHFLYRAVGRALTGPIYVASLDSSERKFLMNSGSSNVVYAQGHILFLQGTTLMAQPFDARHLVLRGDAFPVAERISTTASIPTIGVFSASDSGVLAYQTGTGSDGTRIEWFDRTGKQIGGPVDASPLGLAFGDIRLSPDGMHAAASILDGDTTDTWLYDFARGVKTRFTFGPKSSRQAIWSSDGSRVMFASSRSGHSDLYEKSSDGAGSEDVVFQDNFNKYPLNWSPDGRFVLYLSYSPNLPVKLFVLPLFGERKPFPFQESAFPKFDGQFSPDGRWVAYVTNESGKNEVYVAPFRGTGGKQQISIAGGTIPRWRGDGGEIFYFAPDLKVMAAAVDGKGAKFEVKAVKALFQTTALAMGAEYDVSSDGRRFLISMAPAQPTASGPFTVVVNWTAAGNAGQQR